MLSYIGDIAKVLVNKTEPDDIRIEREDAHKKAQFRKLLSTITMVVSVVFFLLSFTMPNPIAMGLNAGIAAMGFIISYDSYTVSDRAEKVFQTYSSFLNECMVYTDQKEFENSFYKDTLILKHLIQND